MSQIDQIQITYIPLEDRLLLRVSSSASQEFRFWLTQRFVRAIWPAFSKTLSDTPRIKQQVSPVAKSELLAYEHEQAIERSDFSTPYKDSENVLPLGEAPILLAKMQLRNNADGSVTLAMAPANGAGIDLALNHHLLHSLTELILNASRVAKWDIEPLVTRNDEARRRDDAPLN